MLRPPILHHCPPALTFLVVKLFNVAAQVWHLKLGVVIGCSDWSTLAGYALLSEFAFSRLDEVFLARLLGLLTSGYCRQIPLL